MKIIPELTITPALVTSNNATDADAEWDISTSYDTADRVSWEGRIWISAQNSNLAHDPSEDDGTYWSDDGPTNSAAFYDGKVTTRTERADSLTLEFELNTLCRGLALFNVSGGSVTVEVDEDSVTVFSETRQLVDLSDATDYWEYTFTEPTYRTDIVFPSVPIFTGTTLRIIITATGGTAALGKLVVGRVFTLGPTLIGSGPRFVDYSTVTFDTFGEFERVVRDYAKGANFSVGLNPEDTDRVMRLFTTYRGQIVAAFPDDDMERYGLTVVGFLSSFEPDLPSRGITPVSVELKGIT